MSAVLSQDEIVTRPTIRCFLSVTTILAFCCTILATTGLDLVAGNWLSSAAFAIGTALSVHFLASLVGLRLPWRFVGVVVISALVNTFLWKRQVSSGNYVITIGPEIVFIVSSIQFTIVVATVEIGFVFARWYAGWGSKYSALAEATEQSVDTKPPSLN